MHKIKFYVILLVVLLVLSLGSLAWLTHFFAPDRNGSIAVFYSTVFLAAFSATSLIGFYIRRLFGQREFMNDYIALAMRQAMWLALILIISLILSHLNLFTWINATILVLAFVFFESYLLTRNDNPN